MKNFLKTTLLGFEVILVSAMSVIKIAGSIIIFANLHKMTGWQVLVYFIFALLTLVVGVALMWGLGYAVIEDNKEKNEEKSK